MNISQIDSDTDFLCGSTSATYSTTNKRRNHNIAYQDIATIIWESDGTWAFDDANATDTPIATRTIANASASYMVPTTALRIQGVEVKDANGDWQKLRAIALGDLDISPEEYLTGTGMPVEYMLNGNEIRLFPAPGTGYVTMTSGMAVRLNRAVTEIAVTATTTIPGFATAYHRILSLAAAIDFTQNDQQRKFLVGQRARLENGLRKFYSRRADEYRQAVRPVNKKKWRQYT